MRTVMTFSAVAALALTLIGTAGMGQVQGGAEAGDLIKRDGLVCRADSGEPFTGPVTSYFPNGRKESEGAFRDGRMHGKWTTWYENGQKEAEGEFRDGKEHGKWTGWHENGKVKFEAEYRDGRMISGEAWDEHGNPENLWVEEWEPI